MSLIIHSCVSSAATVEFIKINKQIRSVNEHSRKSYFPCLHISILNADVLRQGLGYVLFCLLFLKMCFVCFKIT